MKTVAIGNAKIGAGQPCFIVAEIGAMYEDINGMKKLIRTAKKAGADAVKIQTYRAETIALPGAEFEFEDSSRMSQMEFFKRYEISRETHKILFDYAREIGITIFSTPSYYDDVDFLNELGVPAFKIGSDDLTNYPFLEYAAVKGKPMIVSTGMATLKEVKKAVDAISKTGNGQFILLQCTTSYPAEPQYANLNIIRTFQSAFGMPIGYSDHVPGILSSVLAAGMGASLIEKHLTLNRVLKRPDYQVSIEPSEFEEMVKEIRLVPVLQGESIKKVYPPEEKWRKSARKSIVAVRDIKKGARLRIDDVKIIRPGLGVDPGRLDAFVNKILKRDLFKNEAIPEDAV